MTKVEKHLETLSQTRVSTIIRTKTFDHAYNIVKGSYMGGIKFVEITLTIERPFELIKKCSEDFPDLNIGAGTILTVEEAKKAIECGATYIVSPVKALDVVKWCAENDILSACGAITPSEFYEVYSNGGPLIKFYPATSMPMNYIGIVKNPFPEVNVLATGGINKNNAAEYIKNGAFAVGVTEELGGAAEGTSVEEIAKIAKEYLELVKNAK